MPIAASPFATATTMRLLPATTAPPCAPLGLGHADLDQRAGEVLAECATAPGVGVGDRRRGTVAGLERFERGHVRRRRLGSRRPTPAKLAATGTGLSNRRGGDQRHLAQLRQHDGVEQACLPYGD